MRLDHVALAVPNLDRALEKYQNGLGLKASLAHELPEHGVRVAFVQLENSTIELMEPFGNNSPIAAFIERNPNGGIHHLCIGDCALDATLQKLESIGVRRLGFPKKGAHGNLVMFLHPKDMFGTLIELEQIG